MPVLGCAKTTKRRTEDISPINFSINGHQHTVTGEYDLTTTLNDYIRDGAGLPGTKVMCKEGGCGCCAVTVTKTDHSTGKDTSFSINSCLCPLYSVDGWKITTTEGLGNSKDGFHPIQKRIAEFNGTQCGYCTPGMVMNMYGILQKNATPTEAEIEDQFGGNICRCTGYRPILDAMKSFAKDSTIPGASCIDIEDLKICPRTGKACEGHGDSSNGSSANGSSANGSSANGSSSSVGFLVKTGGKSWYRPQTLKNLVRIFQTNKGAKIRLVHGNTASGIYKNEGPFDVFVDLHDVKELYKIESSPKSFRFGAGLSISDLIEALQKRADDKGYSYFNGIANHLLMIGNVLVRNAGSWAGNLMIKNGHPDFPSDVFTPLEAAGAKIYILDSKDGSVKSQTLTNLARNLDMTGKIITSVELFKQVDKYRFRSYKIMPRSQNAHAYVNAAFRVTIEPSKFQVLGKPSLVYGGIDKNTIHATKTEEFLTGKCLTDPAVLRGALESLKAELNPDYEEVLASVEFRRNLAVSLFYKFILNICESKTPLKSGGVLLERPISKGQREFPEQKAEWPLKQPMPKLTAPLQASGEAEFINDMPSSSKELCGSFVLTSVGCGTIDHIDPSEALLMPGVVDFITAKDVVTNNVMPSFPGMQFVPEELFCSGEVKYSGQSLGFIIAESQTLADAAADKVKVTYKDVKPAIVTIEDAIREESYHANPMVDHKSGDPEDALSKASRKLTGECRQGGLYHFYMENNVALAVPAEDRLDVYTSSQGTDPVQAVLATVLDKPHNYFNVCTPRVGGAFGGKVFASLFVSAAAGVAAYKHNRPVKCNVGLSTSMRMNGKRPAVLAKYEVGFDDSGRINVISFEIYANCGHTANFALIFHEILTHIDQGYHIPNWRVKIILCKTNRAPANPMRGPGPYPAGFFIESVLENVAKSLGKVAADVKEANLYKEGQMDILGHELKDCTLGKLWQQLRQTSEFDKRRGEVDTFNKGNLWKKRGITMTPAKYGFFYMGAGLSVDVAIYARDGTVTVSQGGVEMGQGLYTKVLQAVANTLGIPLSMVRMRHVNSHLSANSTVTGGSVSSEHAVQSAITCCETLNERLQPFRAKHPDYDWKNIIGVASLANVDLTAKHKFAPKKHDGPGMFQYFSYSAAVTEVELDVLTGESQIRRVDILFDCGESLNPTIDIGQIEGAYLMGVGGFMFEEVKYDSKTGGVLNDGTWEYKPPLAKDVPIDWRIKLLADTRNPLGIRGSKASGEPPIVLSSGVYYSLKQAMEAAQLDNTGSSEFQPSVAPLTVERLRLGCGFNIAKMTL
ncbi:xanthine dehydrogenase/oxidase-like [Haliotis asinina]|uniref:xanthine dehydrogenase/oxidase-like n=1 Tax=Haliotis asinina TaxID=109174 RepID=UPI0035319E20